MPERARREKLFYFALVPAIVLAVLVLGGLSLRSASQIERARRQTVFDATLTLADERVDSLDKLVIAQDNVVAAHVDLQGVVAAVRAIACNVSASAQSRIGQHEIVRQTGAYGVGAERRVVVVRVVAHLTNEKAGT